MNPAIGHLDSTANRCESTRPGLSLLRRAGTQSKRRGVTLLELIYAAALLTGVVTTVTTLFMGGCKAWDAHRGDYVMIESAQATLRHLVRQIRQAEAVTAISTAGDAAGTISVLMPSGQTYVWARNSGTNEVNFGVSTATNLLAESITALNFTGYRADGVTTTTTANEIQAVKAQVQIQLPRETGGARTIASWIWLRAW